MYTSPHTKPAANISMSCITFLAMLMMAACGDDAPGGDRGDTGVPEVDYCDPVADWPSDWQSLENDVLELVNTRRSQGAECGSEGSFDPVPPLAASAALRCAARVHSRDMAERDYFDHTNPEGQSPWTRMELAGYMWRSAGENIALGSSTAAGVMEQWMSSDGHCANIMKPDFTEIGVGYYEGNYWTQVFGSRR